MKSCSKLVVLILVCFALVACGMSDEEKAVAEAMKGLTSQEKAILEKALKENSRNADPYRPAMPKCAKRGADRRYINGVGCTDEERNAWEARGRPDEY